MLSFTFHTPPNIIVGVDTINQLGDQVKRFNGKRVFIITDPGIAKVGLLEKVNDVLKKNGLETGFYDQVVPEPPIDKMDEIASLARAGNYDVLVGLGGGSSIDVTKVASILITNGGSALDYIGTGKVNKPGVPTIMLPTTAGTGSEATAVAIFSFPEEKTKKGIVSPYLYTNTAIVDPALTFSLPPSITANTGMDAFVHAVESYISKQANTYSEGLSLLAIELIANNLRTAVTCGDNVEARYNMSLGSLIAGIAFGNASCGAVHAMAYPLGGEFHIPHGMSNTLMLRYVMEYNVVTCMDKFVKIAAAMGEVVEGLTKREAAFKAIDAMIDLAADVGVPTRLCEVDIPKEAIPRMAKSCYEQQQRLLGVNPRNLTQQELEQIYTNAW
jgi:alcohol dehydrogenase class IV